MAGMDSSSFTSTATTTLAAAQRRTLRALSGAQLVAALGLAAATSGSLLARHITGSDGAGGLPLAAVSLGSALTVLLIGPLMDRGGRRPGLTAALVLGSLGAAAAVVASAAASLALLLAGCVLFGSANAAIMFARYAAADLSVPAARGRSIGLVVFAAALGVVAGPNLLAPAAPLARALGLPDAAGLFVLAVLAFAAAAAVLTVMLRPDPLILRRQVVGAGAPAALGALGPRAWLDLLRIVGMRPAFATLAAANLVMVGVMALVPLHLAHNGHSLAAIGVLVSVHTAAMFAPAPLTGWMVDRLGPAVTGAAGAVLLGGAGLLGATVSPAGHLGPAAVLFLLGLGWNAALVAGSAMVAAAAPERGRAQAEAGGEIAMALAAAIGAAAAGWLIDAGGFPLVSIAAGGVSGLLLVTLFGGAGGGTRKPMWPRSGRRRLTVSCDSEKRGILTRTSPSPTASSASGSSGTCSPPVGVGGRAGLQRAASRSGSWRSS
jgi:MFS family permease